MDIVIIARLVNMNSSRRADKGKFIRRSFSLRKLHRGGAEHMHKVYTHKDLARFTPRELMLELKARGYVGELLFVEVIRKEHRINIGKLE